MKRNTKKAFQWIVNILQKNNIPFLLSGGFAARLYGSLRPLNDIDIEVLDRHFEVLYPLVKDYIIYGHKRYIDDSFDLLLMTLKFENQEIDISGAETDMLFNKVTQQWESRGTNINKFVKMEIYGLTVPIIRWQDLVAYKKKIGRPTDIEDAKIIVHKNRQ